MNNRLIKLTYRRERERTTFERRKLQLSLYRSNITEHSQIVMKHWHLLHIYSNLAEIFQNPPILAFHRNKNFRNIIGTKLIENVKVKSKFTNKIRGKCTPCLGNNKTSAVNKSQIATFRSNQTNIVFQIFHNLNCKSKYVIYLLECTKCKIQYAGKAETEFNIRLNNYRKDVWKPDAILSSRHFFRQKP